MSTDMPTIIWLSRIASSVNCRTQDGIYCAPSPSKSKLIGVEIEVSALQMLGHFLRNYAFEYFHFVVYKAD